MTMNRKIMRPPTTHWRRATCKEVDCLQYKLGWTTIFPANRADLIAIIRDAGLKHEAPVPSEGGMVQYAFPPGQNCPRASLHRVPIESMSPLFVRIAAGERTVQEPDRWLGEFNEEAYASNGRRRRG